MRTQNWGRSRLNNHRKSYATGPNHTPHIESAFSLLKRGVHGTSHKVSIKHLGRYCSFLTGLIGVGNSLRCLM